MHVIIIVASYCPGYDIFIRVYIHTSVGWYNTLSFYDAEQGDYAQQSGSSLFQTHNVYSRHMFRSVYNNSENE